MSSVMDNVSCRVSGERARRVVTNGARLRLLVAAALVVAGCGGMMEDEGSQDAVASQSSELKNGTTIWNSPRFKGVVLLKVYDPASNSWTPCTGFVGSSVGFVTAAHCVTKPLNGALSAPAQFEAWRENVNGTWDRIVAPTFGLAFVHPGYNGSARHDVGVIRYPVTASGKIVAADALALSKTAPNGQTMYPVGHGYYDVGPNDFDQRVRSGTVQPTFNSAAGEYRYRAITASDLWICSADSGGPLRKVESNGKWVTYGIASHFAGNALGAHCGPQSFWAATQETWAWLKSLLGNCTESATQLSCW